MENKSENIKSFFNEYCLASGKFFQTDGNVNRSIDGSGWTPSVDEKVATTLRPYLHSFFEDAKVVRHLDCGTGLGYLPKTLHGNGFESYGVEGAIYLATPSDTYVSPQGLHDALGPHQGMVADKTRILITDLCKPISDPRLKKAFDLTTSFEVIEHVHRDDQLNFWKNLTYLSNYHICAIHVSNEEHDHHCTINEPKEWERIFDDLGIKWKRLDDFPIKNWDCSAFYHLTLPNEITKTNVEFGKPQLFQQAKMQLMKNARIRNFYFEYKEVGLVKSIKRRIKNRLSL